MISGIDPKVDYAFKRVFGTPQNASILIALLNAVLDPPPERRVSDVEILNPSIRRTSRRTSSGSWT